jgi:hypothetical protein
MNTPHPLRHVHTAADTEPTEVIVEEAAARLFRQNSEADMGKPLI